MFILKDKDGNLQIHLTPFEVKEILNLEGNIRITLTTNKAVELEDRLEESLHPK